MRELASPAEADQCPLSGRTINVVILYSSQQLDGYMKNCFNIPCNYTMTHYTIFTIKQQILILKL